MTETQRRIRAYKKALPELRERVIAVALLLAMSASMLASASFAWITLSTAPEVSGMATTVAANGNLEIALAQGDSMTGGVPIPAEEPLESAIGDSSVIQGIVNSNNTWGNLINLSEPEYGVSQIALRPALLNNMNLNIAPLYGAMYGDDGRVINTSVNYGYGSWQDIGKGIMDFAAGDKTKYGVRAISALTYDTSVGEAILEEYVTAARTAYDSAAYEYQRLIDPDHQEVRVLAGGINCIQALEGLVGVFAQDQINDMEVDYKGIHMELWPSNVQRGTLNSCSKYIYNAYEMLVIMRDILLLEGEGLRNLANRQAYTNTKEGEVANPNTYNCVVAEQGGENPLLKYTDAQLKAAGISLATYNEFRNDYNKIVACINNLTNNASIVAAGGIERFKNPNDTTLPPVYYSEISGIVNELANIDTTTINDVALSDFAKSPGAAVDLLLGGKANVIIRAGLIPRFELRAIAGAKQRINEPVSVTVQTRTIPLFIPKGTLTVNGTVQTASLNKGDGTYMKQFTSLGSGGFTGIGDAVAQDTYGMAIDLWLRTNYPNAVLTLEGSVLTEKVHAQDANGNYLYTMTVDEITTELYKTSLSSNTYYYVGTEDEVPEEELQNPQIVYTDLVIGYEGENRVWSEDALAIMAEKGFLEEDPTTQGGGSCFVFYADSQSEQAKLLEMLQSFTVAFIDESGAKLASAKLNTAQAFKNQGRVSVPMEITESQVTYEEKNDLGETLVKNGIMQMVQNKPTRITAIVYLDGTNLQNQNVLAAGELSGQLNIQFGTDALLVPPADQELQREHRTITASAVSDDGQTWPTGDPDNNVIKYERYSEDGHDITVNLEVDGVQPDKISGFFVRVINDTQGERMETEEFTTVVTAAEGEDGGNPAWTATFHLTEPGKYVLSDLLVDGMQYHLDNENHPTVTIPGLSLGVATTIPGAGSYTTAKKTYPVNVTVPILSDMGSISSVTVHFYEKGNISNQIIEGMSRIPNTNNWTTEILFNKTGTYVLDSVTVDGRSMDISNKIELSFRLGMYCEVYNNHPDGKDTFTDEGQVVQIPVTAKIWDDGNNPVTGETGVKLNYSIGRSSINLTTAEMTWNSAGYYEGTLNLTACETYSFNSLVTGTTGSIDKANAAPVFRLNPKDPPEYVSATAPATQLAIDYNTPAVMQANIANATNATVWAEMKSGNTTRYVQGVRDTGNIFVFTFNTNDGDNKNDLTDGTWTLNNLYVQGFTHTDGTEYPVTDPNNGGELGYRLEGVAAVQTRIIQTVKVNAVMEQTTYEGVFMEQHQPKVTVTVTDQQGNAIPDITVTGGRWNVIHTDGTQLQHGGYTGSYGSGRYTDADNPKTGLDIVNGVAQIDDLRTAGVYTSNLTVNISAENGTANYSATGPSFTVKSTAPTVKFTDITMDGAGAYSVDLFETGSIYDDVKSSGGCGSIGATNNYTTHTDHLFASKNTQYISKLLDDGKTAYLYFKCSHEDVATYSDKNFVNRKPHAYSYSNGNGVPAATFKLSGMGYATNAKLTFTKTGGGDVMMITQYTADRTGGTYWGDYSTYGTDCFEWTADGDCKRFIGIMDNGGGQNGSDSKTAAGTITANTLTLTCGGNSFDFAVDTFTIHNPY